MHTPIKLREKIGYGLGDAASSMFWKLFGSYLLFFYTDVFGLPAAAAGTMFLVTRLWDSFVDPVVGVLADRTRSRRGKFRPYLLRFAVPFGIAAVSYTHLDVYKRQAEAVAEYLARGGSSGYIGIKRRIIEASQRAVAEHIRLFESDGKA